MAQSGACLDGCNQEMKRQQVFYPTLRFLFSMDDPAFALMTFLPLQGSLLLMGINMGDKPRTGGRPRNTSVSTERNAPSVSMT